jgi:UDP-N-acetylglucosamine--N-acetylmuramyl-(pentapeptide) pyrophosphoryl-undecaprenol N-acetylglucosamine transferase
MQSGPSARSLDDGLVARPGEKILFVASTGGHLAQLNRFADLYCPSENSMWVTFETPQSLSLLAGRRTLFVPYVKPRDIWAIWTSFLAIRRLLRREKFDRVISTGAGLAVGAFTAAKLSRIPSRYIESVSRVDGPSLTGRIVERLRLADLNTQHDSWASSTWKRHPSVLSRFKTIKGARNSTGKDLKIFVTLGTIRPYPFDSAVDALLRTNAACESTIWQLGSTAHSNLPGSAFRELTSAQFADAAQKADVVVTHAGVGTILQLLEMGIHPVVLARRSEFGEHIDNHQLQITRLVSELGIATAVDPHDLTIEHLQAAANLRTVLEEKAAE